jgi:hypothetical protein
MVKKIRKKKGRMDKSSFGYKFVTTKSKLTDENKVCFQNDNVLIGL